MNTNSDITVPPQTYTGIFLRFLKFGFLAWGGPFAQIAMIKLELVEEEKGSHLSASTASWLSTRPCPAPKPMNCAYTSV